MQDGRRYKVDRVGQDHESIVVKIRRGCGQVSVVYFNKPSNRLSSQDLDVACEQIQGKVVWCGVAFLEANYWFVSVMVKVQGIVIKT